MREVAIPAVGFAMTEAVLVRWTKQPGDAVSEGEAVAEIETDKTTADLDAPASGILGRHRFAPGAVVPVGTALTVILAPGEIEADGPGATGGTTPVGEVETGIAHAAPAETALPADRPPHRESPRQRAARGGSAIESAAASSVAGVTATDDAGRFRALIADKVSESWRTIPHFAVTRELSADVILEIRSARTGSAGHVPTVTDLLVRALAVALRATGQVEPIDVGLAVATPAGVAIPILRDVLALSVDELSAARKAAVERARSGRLSPDDLQHPPRSTLSNLGALGIDQFTGVIAVGQTSLLTVGRIARRVVAIGDTIAIRSTFIATLNADHRALDGADAAGILDAFASAVTSVDRLDHGALR